ncbi:DUF7521 family protein [Haloplanus salilacus]|uniref:DUF7521 family protein n=1 Tax=Haloplanus salilacus TaxID=2949994 RepID=UPI0030D1AA3B
MLIDSILLLSRIVAVLLSLSITATSYRAYRRTAEETFQYTMIGFAILGAGLGIESFLLRVVPLTLSEIHAIESFVFMLGFVVLYLSINGRPAT